ncbi:MAG: hypothetical protein IJ906_01075, partial [Oscillospiraceae bacterium]|nr:hypothetical protein [Oscillospiraceae bacterium]
MMVENIKQFMDQPQTYRVDDGAGWFAFITYDNSRIRDSIFDIKIVAEKQSPFSRAAQNETAKEMYSMGFFAPEQALPALACIDMMEFEGKDKVRENIQRNSQVMQQMQAMAELITQLDMAGIAPGAAAAVGLAPQEPMPQEAPPAPEQPDMEGTA